MSFTVAVGPWKSWQQVGMPPQNDRASVCLEENMARGQVCVMSCWTHKQSKQHKV